MSFARYVAFDCETTGVDELCNLLTVSFIVLDKDLNSIDSLDLSIKQSHGYVVYPEALAINKIDLIKHHTTSIELEQARNMLHTFLNTYKRNYLLIPIGHNIAFDIRFIKTSGLITAEEFPKYFSHNHIDTVTISQFMKVCGHLPLHQSISLTNLSAYYSLSTSTTLQHSSHYDTQMTIKLLKQYKDMVSRQIEDDNTITIRKKRRLE
jgi:DNA polymerase III epsilon subunit-like protein